MKIIYRERPRYAPKPLTRRRLAAAERALQRERAKAPLSDDQIAERQPSPDERVRRFNQAAIDGEQRMRDFHASCWRKGRKLLRSLPGPTRAAILEKWNRRAKEWPGSATGVSFSDFVWRHATGRDPL